MSCAPNISYVIRGGRSSSRVVWVWFLIWKPQSVKIEPSGSSSQHEMRSQYTFIKFLPTCQRHTQDFWILVTWSPKSGPVKTGPVPPPLAIPLHTEKVIQYWRCVVKVWVAGNPLTLTSPVPRPHPAVHVEESLGVWATPWPYCY